MWPCLQRLAARVSNGRCSPSPPLSLGEQDTRVRGDTVLRGGGPVANGGAGGRDGGAARKKMVSADFVRVGSCALEGEEARTTD